jgi:transcription antitermination factor NusG
MKRKVGDKVTIRKDLKIHEKYGADVFDNHMIPYLGRQAKIIKIYEYKNTNKYDLDIDDSESYWTDEMFKYENKLKTKGHTFKVGDKVELPKTKSIGSNYFDIAIRDIKYKMNNEKTNYCIIHDIYENIIYIEGFRFTPEDLVPYVEEEKNVDINIMFANGVGVKAIQTKDIMTIDANTKYRVINGSFKGIEGYIETIDVKTSKVACRIYPYAQNYIVDLRVDDNNLIHINVNDIEQIYVDKTIEESVPEGHNIYNIQVKYRGRRTTVKLVDYNIKASVYCNKEDFYDKTNGKTIAFKKALAKKYQLEYEKAIED